ncbi:putative thioesterase lcsE [Paramyrothecium foliicola]|nr:putative thioesterase lcsE [Paramyrothecium foliicola]
MFPDGPNPIKVQFLPPYKRASSTPPLVLIHDGGGTTFSYFILGKLHRDVWALHNPKYWDAGKWEGGMDEMSRHYVDLIKKSGLSGPIFLGGKQFPLHCLHALFSFRDRVLMNKLNHLGWSLGGFLSLSIARLLADDPSSGIVVAGLLIIDSPRHIPRSELRASTVEPELSELPELIKKSFDNCDEMLDTWQLPTWNAPTKEGKSLPVAVTGRTYTIQPGTVLHKPLQGGWTLRESKRFNFETPTEETKAPPPAVLIRCTLPAKKSKAAQNSQDPCLIDLFRDEPLLGWEGAYPDYIVASIDVEADHYNVFDKFDNDKVCHSYIAIARKRATC